MRLSQLKVESNSPYFLKPISSSSPPKNSQIQSKVNVGTRQEQTQLLSNLNWRMKTSMPVVKVLSYQSENSQSKTYKIEVQKIQMAVSSLNNVEIPQILYLIQQLTLGVHALGFRYHNFDFHKVFYGINSKGEPKVWVHQNFFSHVLDAIALPSQDIMITHIVKMVQNVCSQTCKSQIKPLIQQINSRCGIKFSQLNYLINSFAIKNKITIPGVFHSQGRPKCSSLVRSDLQSHSISVSKVKNNLTPCKVNFRYESPLPKSSNVFHSPILTKMSIIQASPKPQVKWNYPTGTVSANCSPAGSMIYNKENNGMHSSVYQLGLNSFDSMLMNSQKLKNKLKMSRNMGEGHLLQSGFGGCEYHSKNIGFSTPSISTNCSRVFQGQKITPSTSFLMENSNNNNNVSAFPQISSTYNFGGLLSLPEISPKKSEYMSEQMISAPSSPSRASSPKKDEIILRSIIVNQISNFETNNQINDLFGDQDMKYSVYCGEQKKAQPLQIKLQLLGKMGRNIAASNVIMDQRY